MTKQECEKLLKKAGYEDYGKNDWDYDGVYVLAHGEYARRTIKIRRRRNGEYGIKIEYFFYRDTLYKKKDHYLTDEEEFYLNEGLKAI